MRHLKIVVPILVLLVSCGKNGLEKNLHISGTVSGLKKGILYIRKISDTTLVTIDTIKISGDSDFTSDLTIDSPEMYYLYLDRGATNSLDNNLGFFAEAGTMNINTSLAHFLSDARITGSRNQKKYDEFKKVASRFNDQNLTLMAQKLTAFKNRNQKLIDSIEILQDKLVKRRYLYATNFALTNKNMEVAPFVALSEIADINMKYLDTIRKSMTPEVARSLYGKKLTAYCHERNRRK